MTRLLVAATGLIGLCCLATASPGADAPSPRPGAAADAPWRKDRVDLAAGGSRFGLVESEDENWLYLTEIHQSPGRRTHLVIRPIERSAVAAVARLEPGERTLLQQRIAALVNRARIEEGRMEAVALKETEGPDGRFRAYRGKWFDLESGADEETTRRMVVRVEQMFTAYRQVLPPRTDSKRRLRLVVFPSIGAYREFLERHGLAIQNPAVFLEKENLVAAGSDLGRFAAQLARVRAQNAQVGQQLDQLRAELPRKLEELGRKLAAQNLSRDDAAKILLKERGRIEEEIKKKEQQIKQFNRQNAQVFDQVTQQMFVRLYHEAFHAYLENYVFPGAARDVPLWLNEGLAMIFEGGILEADTLRIDAPNKAALKLLKDEIRQGRYLPLAELLAAGPKEFLSPAGDASGRPDRYYSYAWGLAYYLTFERRVLDGPALDKYVSREARRLAPAERLERLAGTPLGRLQADWQEYVLGLR